MGTEGVRERLQAALTDAMKQRERDAVGALRSALGAIANAEAVPAVETAGVGEHIAGAVAGVGAADVDRRMLDEHRMCEVVAGEIDAYLDAAETSEQAGRADDAAALRRRAAVLQECLAPPA